MFSDPGRGKVISPIVKLKSFNSSLDRPSAVLIELDQMEDFFVSQKEHCHVFSTCFFFFKKKKKKFAISSMLDNIKAFQPDLIYANKLKLYRRVKFLIPVYLRNQILREKLFGVCGYDKLIR